MTELPTFITGNENKVKYLRAWLGLELPHKKLDLDEIQSLDLEEVVTRKARQAYDQIASPVLVEDVGVTFAALGRLPGPFIKWFEDPGIPTLCRMLDGFNDRRAEGRTIYALYDGDNMHLFEGVMRGSIAKEPRGAGGFGFDPIFINEGQTLTRAEMDEAAYAATSYRVPALAKLRDYLQQSR